MSDLVEFLQAQLDQDEQAARNATPSPWKAPDEDESDDLWLTPEDAYHIYRWEPERVLAEVEAKRGLMEVHQRGETGHGTAHCLACDVEDGGVYAPRWPCRALRLLALPYADRPDYRDEWRP